jgi:lipopolysaccharide export system protein LptC
LESEENEGWEGKLSSKEEIASIRDSLMDNPHKTKYSSQTIQPATQLPPGKLNYLITSISVSYYENTFGNKFLKVYIPNKHYY